MNFVYDVFVFLHLVGMASLVGGWLVQMPLAERRISNAMLHGALTQVVTGLVLTGMASGVDSLGEDVDNAKIAVKLLVALVVLALVVANRRRSNLPAGVFMAAGGLAVLNVAVAVFWR